MVVTFHNAEQNELEDVLENIKPKTIWPPRNHPLKLKCVKTKLETPWELIWDPIEIMLFGTMKPLWQVHMPKKWNWLTLKANWLITPVSREGAFWWNTKRAFLEDEHFEWKIIPLIMIVMEQNLVSFPNSMHFHAGPYTQYFGFNYGGLGSVPIMWPLMFDPLVNPMTSPKPILGIA